MGEDVLQRDARVARRTQLHDDRGGQEAVASEVEEVVPGLDLALQHLVEGGEYRLKWTGAAMLGDFRQSGCQGSTVDFAEVVGG